MIWGGGNVIYGEIDRAERHHGIALVDAPGPLSAKHRITDDAAGYPLPLDGPHRLPSGPHGCPARRSRLPCCGARQQPIIRT